MFPMQLSRYLVFISIVVVIPSLANAIPPPDFIFNFILQMGQVFAIAVVFVTACFGSFFHFFRQQWLALKKKRTIALLALFALVILGTGGTYLWQKHQSEIEYETWRQAALEELRLKSATAAPDLKKQLIETQEKLAAAKRLQHEGEDKSASLDAELVEARQMLVAKDIPDSLRKLRERKGIINHRGYIEKKSYSDFYKKNVTTSLMISNAELQKSLVESPGNLLLLDAREDIEFESGHLPGAKHIRLADLRSGRWTELSTDRQVIIFCYSALRGSDAAEYLRSVGVLARFVQEGIKSWVETGGAWQGQVALLDKYRRPQHLKRMGRVEFKKLRMHKAVLSDTRPPDLFREKNIEGSLNISVLNESESELEKSYARVPAHATILPVCSGHWSCFDAYIVGVELERRGHPYMGRFDQLDKLKELKMVYYFPTS